MPLIEITVRVSRQGRERHVDRGSQSSVTGASGGIHGLPEDKEGEPREVEQGAGIQLMLVAKWQYQVLLPR